MTPAETVLMNLRLANYMDELRLNPDGIEQATLIIQQAIDEEFADVEAGREIASQVSITRVAKTAALKKIEDAVDENQQRFARQQQVIEQLVEMINKVEWRSFETGMSTIYVCPWCSNEEPNHKPSCDRCTALAAAKELK